MASHIQRLFLRIGRSPSPLNTYLALVAVAGLLVGAWVLRDAAAAFAGVDLTFWLLTACALPAELARFTVWRPDGQAQVTITMARPFALALVIMRGAPLAVPVFVIASVVSDLIHRKPAVRILFNASQYVLSLAAASATYTALGGQGWVTVEKIPAFVAAAVVMLVVNFLLVRLVVALHQRLPVTIRYLFGSSTVSEFVEGGVWIALLLVAFLVSKRQLTLMLPVLLALAALPLVVAGRMAERVSALVAARSRGRAGEVAALQRRGDAVLRIAELERVRLAADLHDGPVQHNQQQLERIRTVRASIKAGNPVAARVLDQLEQEVMTQTQNLRGAGRRVATSRAAASRSGWGAYPYGP